MELEESGDGRFERTVVVVEGETSRGLYFRVIRPSLAEFFGVLFLTFSLCMLRQQFDDGSLIIAFVYIGIYSTTRSISGGHLNPIITLIEMARRETRLVGACYLGAHLLGAVVGAFAVKGVTPDTKPEPITPRVKVGNAIFAEMMGTTIVILAYLTLTRRGKATTAILGIGFAYASAVTVVRRTSSGYLNPALSFGIAAASGVWKNHYVYWVGASLGGKTAAVLHGLIFASDDQLWIKPSDYLPARIA